MANASMSVSNGALAVGVPMQKQPVGLFQTDTWIVLATFMRRFRVSRVGFDANGPQRRS